MSLAIVMLGVAMVVAGVALGQSRTDTAHVRRPAPIVKPDLLTLRYKPQAGTLLYNVHTTITQRVRQSGRLLRGVIHSEARLAIHNVSMNYEKGLWSFDRYFTKFSLQGTNLEGTPLHIVEPGAINRITRFTYQMNGDEVSREVVSPMELLNGSAQGYSYFIRPPTLLSPLPKGLVTYGDTWEDHTLDTVRVRDTVNIGITTGEYIYNIHRRYRFDRLGDSVGSNVAYLTAVDSGTYVGWQRNSVTKLDLALSGPIHGVDTVLLNLYNGRVERRVTRLTIPVTVQSANHPPLEDVLDVRRTMELDESNVVKFHQ